MQQSVAMNGENTLGPYITAMRDAKGMTQKELGDAIGLSRQRVTQLEGGRKPWPAPDVFNGLSRALEIPVQEFLRRGGVSIPEADATETLAWVISQLDDDGREQLADLGRAILPRHLRRRGTEAP
jgi:transcriptional regulator with XRE-family HTH domain